MNKSILTERVRQLFLGNTIEGYSDWKDVNFKFIAPSNREYVFQWLWDTAFHAIVLSNFDVEWAKNEIRNFLLGQWSDGFLPHIIFWGKKKSLPHWAYIESALSIRPRTSSITQPPIFPIAVERVYQKSPDKKFLEEVLPKLAAHHKWLLTNRDNDNDFLISIISPNESGMDELPVFQLAAGYTGLDTTLMHYTYRKGDFLNHRYKFNSEKILQKDYFNVEELLFNVIFIESARSMSRLFRKISNYPEADFFEHVALTSEKSLLEKCWDENDEIFYSLFSNQEKKAEVKTVASLVPIYLAGLKGEKLEALVNKHLLNPNEFFTKYPFPSVAKDEKYYVPHDTPKHQVKLLWRGPTWISTNWLIIKGLRRHKYHDLADKITKRLSNMISKEGFREYYNPETGEGYRRENFGWSTLILDLLN